MNASSFHTSNNGSIYYSWEKDKKPQQSYHRWTRRFIQFVALASWANLFLRYILWWNTDFIRCCYYCSSLSGGTKVKHCHCMPCTTKHLMVWFMVFNTTFNTTRDINYILNGKCSFTIDPLFASLTLLIFVSLSLPMWNFGSTCRPSPVRLLTF